MMIAWNMEFRVFGKWIDTTCRAKVTDVCGVNPALWAFRNLSELSRISRNRNSKFWIAAMINDAVKNHHGG
jgi:hypothetical protein